MVGSRPITGDVALQHITVCALHTKSRHAFMRQAVGAITLLILAGACSTEAPLRPVTSNSEVLRATTTSAGATKGDSLVPFRSQDNAERIRDRYIVRFVQAVDAAETTKQFVSLYRAKPYQVLKGLGGFGGEIPAAFVDSVRADPRVRYIEADVMVRFSGVGDTTQSSAPVWLDRMDQRSPSLNGTYEYSVTGAGVNIWIVDNGVDPGDAKLTGRVSTAYSFSYNGQNPHEICSSM